MKTDELREKYLSFFQSKGHHRQASDVLVPTWDPSVLFTPAGMNQFKDHFLGKVKLEFTRATTCQKCLRTGDIDNVGRTAYHHTFFEMLGNFSFGDYFKAEAIAWAWEFLTAKAWLGIDPERLTITVYKDDDEAAKIWNEKIGVPMTRITRMDEADNFWPASAPSQGPDGVCGPCSEIYYTLDSGKSVEIWNLVFTQFNRVGDPPDNLRPLPSKNIDTGMGLERTASVLQNVPTNFHIDILYPIVQAAAEVCGIRYEYDSDNGRRLRRITDHVRACTFAIHENVYPGPKKARYVIKRLLRRAVLDGHQIGMRDPFLFQLVPTVAQMMKASYPELSETVDRVAQVMKREESDFFATIDSGLERIQRVFADMSSSNRWMVDGNDAANLYQTYGVPPELFQQIAAEKNFTFDWDGYRQAMAKHGDISGGGVVELFETGPIETLKEAFHHSDFLGYETTVATGQVKGIIVGKPKDDRLVSSIAAETPVDMLRVVLDRSPFYGESGGQVGDAGQLKGPQGVFEVTDTQRSGELIVHYGRMASGILKEGETVHAIVDELRRDAIRRAHSATHILHHALQTHLGKHAQQQGSKVDADWLRFDFSHQDSLTEDQLKQIEDLANTRIAEAAPITWSNVPLATAREAGAMMLFGEKYPDPVRMVSMGTFSKELCGGTHLNNTSEVDTLELLSEESVSSGVRRVTALTGKRAKEQRERITAAATLAASRLGCSIDQVGEQTADLVATIRKLKKLASGSSGNEGLPDRRKTSSVSPSAVPSYGVIRTAFKQAARTLNVSLDEVADRIQSLFTEEQQLRAQVAQLAAGGAVDVDAWIQESELVQGARLIVRDVPNANAAMMRQWIDQIRKKSKDPVAILLATAGEGKVTLIAALSPSLVERGLSAGRWISPVAQEVGGSGGGKADLAQAGGKNPEKIADALKNAVEAWRSMAG
ncbi:MAG: alanine--tRNA ligase [Pirellula sp.]|jgi:alanyl-tRNA synthetase|nr:alanine--tRNA ligase [Pirellula sp.]